MKTSTEFRNFFINRSEEKSCICGSSKGLLIKTLGRYGAPLKIVSCLSCGHIRSKNQLNQGDLKDFYMNYYRDIYSGGYGLKSTDAYLPRVKKSKEEILFVLEQFVPLEKDPLVIEWGCGAGWNLIPLRDKGYRVKGYDLDVEYTKFGSDEYGLDLSLLDDYDPKIKLEVKADFLILNHVLEHVVDPGSFLLKLKNMFKDDGYLYIGLPVIETLPIWGFRRFFHIAHIHYFVGKYFLEWVGNYGLECCYYEHERGIYLLRKSAVTKKSSNGIVYGLWYIFKWTVKYRLILEPATAAYLKMPFLHKPYRFLKSLIGS